jgi:hypothetical protein
MILYRANGQFIHRASYRGAWVSLFSYEEADAMGAWIPIFCGELGSNFCIPITDAPGERPS